MHEEVAKPFLTTREVYPENQETPIHAVNLATIPEDLFYRRNHFAYPSLQEESCCLQILGEVSRPLTLQLNVIRSLPSRTIPVILECAGNKRSFFEPKTFGEQWERGAIGQGIWKGVPLSYLLQLADVKASAKEIVVEAWDAGRRPDLPGIFSFARSMPIEKAMHPDTLIAYEYNGQELTFRHGFPFRLIVPQWYAMASVKWVRRIMAIPHRFEGPFQTIDYQYYVDPDDDRQRYPVTILHVNSSIQRPVNLSILQQGKHVIQGIAWTGLGEIKQVQLSLDGGDRWIRAQLRKYPDQPHSWVHWHYEWKVEQTGEYRIMSRSEDTYGRIQPMTARWNRKGYGNNAVDQVHVTVV